MKLKNKIITIKKVIPNSNDCQWFTFKQGQNVPEELIELAKQHGAEFELEVKKEPAIEKEIIEEPVVEVKKKVTKKKVAKKKRAE